MTDSTIKFTRTQQAKHQVASQIGFMPEFSLDDEMVAHRKADWQVWNSIPFPEVKDEHWKRTPLKELELDSYIEASKGMDSGKALPAHLDQYLVEKNQGGRVFISGAMSEIYLEESISEMGVVFSDFKTVKKNHPGLLKKLIQRTEKIEKSKFGALTSALSENGVLLFVPRGIKVEKPLQSITWLASEGVLQTTRILVLLEEGAEVTFVHETSSPEGLEKQSLHTGLFEIFVGKSAKFNFVELQSLGTNVWNLSHENVDLDQNSNLDWIFASLGSKVTKAFSHLNLVGQGATGKMSGFYFSNGTQHFDHDTRQNHLAQNTTSDLLFKGALLGNSRSVWQGMIYVDPNASKTDGYQANRNLVLSEKARADSIPGLEILTDDVRCTHGATVGKIDQDLVFYLESRGLPKKEAEKLIVEGFFDPIMQRIPFENVRERFQKAIEEKMSSY